MEVGGGHYSWVISAVDIRLYNNWSHFLLFYAKRKSLHGKLYMKNNLHVITNIHVKQLTCNYQLTCKNNLHVETTHM